jgi:putative transposase
MNYHRYYDAGEIIFITQVVKDRSPAFQNPITLSLLRHTIENVKQFHPFELLAYVYLPDHFHLLLRSTGLSNFSQIMHSLKSNFTKAYKREFNISENVNFWQRRFWDHVIRDERDLENHIHYIHFNPVKHGYVQDPSLWEASSFDLWVNRGAYLKGLAWDEPDDISWGD